MHSYTSNETITLTNPITNYRTTTTSLSRASTLRRKTTSDLLHAMSSPLLKLPAEMRNYIYELAAHNTDPVSVGSRGNISIEAPILATCHRVRTEALPLFRHCTLASACIIDVSVHNFDFSHVLTFIECMSADQLRAMHNKTLSIKMTMTEDYSASEKAGKNLTRWLHACLGGVVSDAFSSGNRTYQAAGEMYSINHGFVEAFDRWQACVHNQVNYWEWTKIRRQWCPAIVNRKGSWRWHSVGRPKVLATTGGEADDIREVDGGTAE